MRTDRLAMAQAARDVRYYSARRASAELVELPSSDTVRFGTTVTVERANGRRQSFRIVGEDEADAAAGSVSHISPLAVALLGKAVGDEAVVAGSPLEIVSLADSIGRRNPHDVVRSDLRFAFRQLSRPPPGASAATSRSTQSTDR